MSDRSSTTLARPPRSPSGGPLRGFTLVELMIVVLVIAVLAAIALPNYLTLRDRAREGATKSNMHTVQLHSEDYGVRFDGVFSDVMDDTHIAPSLPRAFYNPYTEGQGAGEAWENRDAFSGPPSSITGIVSYADSGTITYNVKGFAKDATLPLVLTSQ